MSTHRLVASPPSKNPRASTGTVFVTSFDTSTSTQPGRSSAGNVPGQNITYQALPIRKSTYHDGKTSKTEYAVRPRQNSAIATENHRPPSISTAAASPPRRGSAAVPSPRDTVPSVVRDNPSRFLQPTSSTSYRQNPQRQRHNSTTRAELDGYDGRDGRDRRDRAYHPRTPAGHDTQKQYHSSRPPLRHQDDDGWSYTGPREQFDRDYPQQVNTRRDSQARKERPTAVYEQDRMPSRREVGPPPSASRQLERIARTDPLRSTTRSGFDSDPDRPSEQPRRRESLRAPVLHQQPPQRDNGYSSAREDHDTRTRQRAQEERYEGESRRRHRLRDTVRDAERDRDRERDQDYRKDYDKGLERDKPRDYDRGNYSRDDHERSDRRVDGRYNKPRSRDPSPERSGSKAIAAGVFGSLATAGTLGMLHRDPKDKDAELETNDAQEHRHRRRRRRRKDVDDSDVSDTAEAQRVDESHRRRRNEESNSDTPEDQVARSSHPRRRRRDEENVPEQRQDVEGEQRARSSRRRDEGTDMEPRQENDAGRRTRSSSRQRFREGPPDDPEPQTRDLVPAHKQEQQALELETRTISPGEHEDERPRRVQLVEPVRDNQELKPRGILKPARQVPFPEDPNPIREGVAPLKDATKDGVPVNARWTKINRVLVNPEALEKYHERFEEREDYVIVLRVLTREEIQKLAEKTKEIREARERDWRRKLEDRKRRQDESDGNGSPEHSDYDDDADREEKPQLAIEDGPVGPALESLNLQPRSHMLQSQGAPQPIPAVREDDFARNYSQNV